jgi:hypothetical protein
VGTRGSLPDHPDCLTTPYFNISIYIEDVEDLSGLENGWFFPFAISFIYDRRPWKTSAILETSEVWRMDGSFRLPYHYIYMIRGMKDLGSFENRRGLDIWIMSGSFMLLLGGYNFHRRKPQGRFLSAIHYPLSTIHYPLSAIHYPLRM